MSKYEPLWNWIKENSTDSFKLTVDEMEKIAGLPIDVSSENYGETFRNVIDSLIPELGLKLAGAVCDFTEPATGQNKLFFPVE